MWINFAFSFGYASVRRLIINHAWTKSRNSRRYFKWGFGQLLSVRCVLNMLPQPGYYVFPILTVLLDTNDGISQYGSRRQEIDLSHNSHEPVINFHVTICAIVSRGNDAIEQWQNRIMPSIYPSIYIYIYI